MFLKLEWELQLGRELEPQMRMRTGRLQTVKPVMSLTEEIVLRAEGALRKRHMV